MSAAMLALQAEWALLQQQYEQYERGAQLIKLASVALFAVGLAWRFGPSWLAVLILLLWVQEAVFKTYQGRLGERLLRVEQGLQQDPAPAAFQLHSEWLVTRPGGLGLLAEYGRSALKPTVSFPYAVLLLLSLARLLC